jgi:hypothetical protein
MVLDELSVPTENGEQLKHREVQLLLSLSEKTGFLRFGFFGRAKMALYGAKEDSPKQLHFGGSKVGGWVHSNRKPGAKTELPVKVSRIEQIPNSDNA